MTKENLILEFNSLKKPIDTAVTSADLQGTNRTVGLSLEKSIRTLSRMRPLLFTLSVLLELVALITAYVNCSGSVFFEILFFPIFIPFLFHFVLAIRAYKHGKEPSKHPTARTVLYFVCYGVTALTVLFSLIQDANGASGTALGIFCASVILVVLKIVFGKKLQDYEAVVNSIIAPNREKLQREKIEREKALVKCVDCGESFSPHAKACPHCGCPIEVCLNGQSER